MYFSKIVSIFIKKTIITCVTSQDGPYIAEFFLKKSYIVHDIKRRSSPINTDRVDHEYHETNRKFIKTFFDVK